MKKTLLILFIFTFCSQAIVAQKETTVLTLKNSNDGPTISKHIYGHFAEHLGKCIYGGFFVGEKSSIPNTKGVRNDIITALKELKIPNLRWPGGCFADTYHWKDGIGPKEDRPSIVNRWWGGTTEDNSFGTHDFLNLCEVLGTEPYLASNVGSGTVQELEQWVQYVNHDGGSPMSELRKKNDREKPWGVTFWGVGNEMWGCGGNMTPEYYANLYKQYATFMTDWSNNDKLFRIASGANVADYHWTEVLMRDIPKSLIEGVALHSYSFVKWEKKGSSTKFNEEQYFATMQTALKMEELVTKHSDIMDKYDPENKVALIVDEWGGWYDVEEGTNPGFLYQQNTMRDAMIAGTTLNIFNNHSKRVKMANLAQTVNVLQAVILTENEKMLLTPTYHVMKMYTVHHDAQLLPMTINSPSYTYNGEKLPALSASASKDKNGLIHISLVNIDSKKDHKIEIDMQELGIKNVTGTILASPKLQDHNTFDNPSKIKPAVFKGFETKKGKLEITIPAFTVVVLETK
ncbi:MAG: alpha-L-arabinofuranosidase C-terminal domain-containing protein [Flavobacterium sp.]|jgi:alpha-N-arabinofuranosidase|uniref:alpha-N-arabinofuranosidase n=1 Tax=unclassified Flavobacterium TaxID=196869 RepID=UPI000C186D46|nr:MULTISPECIES: alpha-L-arabinofuranosidase C-terminal domain-containing protein [unclassified Flavobacterium]MDP3681825.1 alpha-L-arabinofuranosidase C-terminal domain-containing protein [Flavobacterium sp.]PIF61128.1 alpha-N-arabinofuranosidase [Flavobacterium sp. 11]RKS12868.1 alpha-N-arabinofuranosidase [Flavobacterium sp. 120]